MKHNLGELVREVLEKGYLLSLGTQDDGGVWVADVIYTYDDDFNIYWMSMPSRRHSKAIDGKNSNVAGTITVTTSPRDPEMCLQLSGIAKKVDKIPWESVISYFKKRNMPVPDPEDDFLEEHSWYKFTPERIELIYGPKFGYDRQKFR